MNGRAMNLRVERCESRACPRKPHVAFRRPTGVSLNQQIRSVFAGMAQTFSDRCGYLFKLPECNRPSPDHVRTSLLWHGTCHVTVCER